MRRRRAALALVALWRVRWRRERRPTPRVAASQRAAPAGAPRARGSRGPGDLAEVVDGLPQPVAQRDARLPTELAAGAANVWSATAGIVWHRIHVRDARRALRNQLEDEPGVIE